MSKNIYKQLETNVHRNEGLMKTEVSLQILRITVLPYRKYPYNFFLQFWANLK